jgi:LacI family transcriptional regulator
MRRQSHTTLEDIAAKLKVSRVTVSKALRNHPDISEKTKKRVLALAASMGYTPNIMARTLSSRRSYMIGLVVPKIAHFFFSSMIEGVYNAAFEKKYETILTVSQENAERELKHLQTLIAMRVDGIIISISQETRDAEIFKRIRRTGIPLLFVDRRPEPPLPGFGSVLADDRDGAFRAVEQAISVGYRRIGIVGGNAIINIGRERLRGFTEAMEHHDIPVRSEWVVSGGYAKEDGYNAFKQIVKSSSGLPEFVFAVTYPVALGFLQAAKEHGVRVPDDVDIICFGDGDLAGYMSPALSVVRQPTQELGARAVQMILENIGNPDRTVEHHVILPTQLVLRDTCVEKRAQAQAPPDNIVKLKTV